MFRTRHPRGVVSSPALLRLFLLLTAAASTPGAQTAHAQTGRAQITILEYDGTACRQEAARTGRERGEGWYCLRGVVQHPAGVAEVTVGSGAATLRPDSSGGVRFTGVTEMSEGGGDVAVVVRASNGELSEGLYRLTPTPPNPAYPSLQPFAITNLRPRLLGSGGEAQPGASPAADGAPFSPLREERARPLYGCRVPWVVPRRMAFEPATSYIAISRPRVLSLDGRADAGEEAIRRDRSSSPGPWTPANASGW